jgi:hypothetical protein
MWFPPIIVIRFRSVASRKPPAPRHHPLTGAKFGREASLNNTVLANHTILVYHRTYMVQKEGALPGMRAIGHTADAEVHMDAAITLLRQTLPQFGFRIMMPPPLTHAVLPEACASIWLRGEAQAQSWHAATPALALLRAIRNELEDQREVRLLRRCTQCKGIGWYIAVNGAKQMCRHACRSV